MKVFRHSSELIDLPTPIAFVPTMGSLHQGHLSLVHEAKKKCPHVVVSIFVNPMQFGKNEDFNQYPRTKNNDLSLLKNENITAVFLPNVNTIYPKADLKPSSINVFAKLWCAKKRQGHFDGVCSVLMRFIHLLNPKYLFLGEKDFQQYVMVKKMVTDFFLPVEICLVPIVRDPNTGLALSSRNQYLSDLDKVQASRIFNTLNLGLKLFQSGITKVKILRKKMLIFLMQDPEFVVDYMGFVNSETLNPVIEIQAGDRMLIAVFFKGVRLIDNQVFYLQKEPLLK